jgi:hypothetical protein
MSGPPQTLTRGFGTPLALLPSLDPLPAARMMVCVTSVPSFTNMDIT